MPERTPQTIRLRTVAGVLVRFSLYSIALIAVFSSLPSVMRHGGMSLFREGGTLEWCQLAAMLVACMVLLFGAVRAKTRRRYFSVMVLLGVFAALRELDSVLEALVGRAGPIPAVLVSLWVVWIIWRRPRDFLEQTGRAMNGRGLALIWAGFATTAVFAQLVGHGAFLEMLMGNDYTRDYKRVIEELAEFFGYVLLLIGCIESCIEAHAADEPFPPAA